VILTQIVKLAGFVKSPPNGHTGESRYPELLINTGFRVKSGMTKEANYDFFVIPVKTGVQYFEVVTYSLDSCLRGDDEPDGPAS
jgi:hypothetical protein